MQKKRTPSSKRPMMLKADGAKSKAATQILYQFKITLLETKPPIWRRIQVADCTLDKLHEHIQAAMGWMDELPSSHVRDRRQAIRQPGIHG